MLTLTLIDLERSGDITSEALFQTNIVRSANTGTPWFADDVGNPVGTPTDLAHEAIDHFGISMIRYPGGAADASFAAGMMIDGALPDDVVNILTYASQHSLTVDMVVPVDTPDGLTRAEFLSQMADFAASVEARFPGVVTAYELGNEYWNYRGAGDDTLEGVYGVNAAEVAVALGFGMDEAGADADVFLQASGNLRGAFGNSADLANGAIQDAFASVLGAMDVLDGVIRNNYWRDPDLDGFENNRGPFAEDRGLGANLSGGVNSWSEWLGRDVLTMVGEFNINRNIGSGEDSIDMGVHGASYLLEHMTNMIDVGVDFAFAWPIAHNTTNAYIFGDEDIATTTVHGLEIAINTTRAAMLDLMRQTIASHELVHVTWRQSETANDVEVTLFEGVEDSLGERIVFLSSRSADELTLTVDLSTFIGDYLSVTAIAIFYEDTDGHLRDAVVRELPIRDPDGDGVFGLQLLPYEVVQLRFVHDTEAPTAVITLPAPAPVTVPAPVTPEPEPTAELLPSQLLGEDRIHGGSGADLIHGRELHDFISGAAGNDSIYGAFGNDTIYGDIGHDYLHGGPGWDLLAGGLGNDTIIGGSGDDTLLGSFGFDRLVGGDGADFIDGGVNADTLIGNSGNDTLNGDWGFDLLLGGFGHDDLYGGNDSDTLLGFDGNDRLFGQQGDDRLVGESGNDALFGGLGHDDLYGGNDNDTLFGFDGNDRLFGQQGDDWLVGENGNDALFGGMGNDILNGGNGDDFLNGFAGNDTLDGGAGNDWLGGGLGADVFVFRSGHGQDRLLDFEVQSGDRIDLSGLDDALSFADLRLNDPSRGFAVQMGQDVVIFTGVDSSVTLHSIALADLTADHFIF